uniref:Uncharacterized protein n=1 Tax=Glossina palpalis gambiensis TaxID=67801 RepID=A0A1B0B4V1_9MUSC
MATDANLLNFLFGAVIPVFVCIQLAGRRLKRKSTNFDGFLKVLMIEVNNRDIKLSKNSLKVKKNPRLENHVCLIWFCRKNFDKILEKLKDKHSDKRFISIDVKHSSNKLSLFPPKPSSVKETVCFHKLPIPFNSMKTDVGIQVNLEHSENRDVSTILFKFCKKFCRTELTINRFSFKNRREVDKYGNKMTRDSCSGKAIDIYNKIVKSENEDKTVSRNDNVRIFGYKSKTFVNAIEKCPLEIEDIKYQKNNFAHIKAYKSCRNSKKKVCLEYDIYAVKKPKSDQPVQCYFRSVFNHTFFKTSQDLEASNLDEGKSEGVYRKIKNVIIRENDLSSDDLEDSRKRYAKNATEGYQFFQYLAETCEVGLFSRNQVAAIAKKVSIGTLVCHLGATGSILDVRNYIFYYALIITNHRGKYYPVAEGIANTHNACSIAIEIFMKKRKARDNTIPQDFGRDARSLVDAVYDKSRDVSTYKDL